MANLVAALDNTTFTQSGEKQHLEYGWSNNIQEKIAQFSFQVTRTDEAGITRLKNVLTNILTDLKTKFDAAKDTNNLVDMETTSHYLSVLYKMIGHTRDIISGKGECDLTYMMITAWYDFYPELALFAINCLVDLDTSHQYGSWKDMKYLCKYFSKNFAGSSDELLAHPLIQYCVQLMNHQLRKDIENKHQGATVSLLSKWIPRESSSSSFLYQLLAVDFFPTYIQTSTATTRSKAITKAKMDYRKIISQLNKHLDTLEIKQCDKSWASIDFSHVTSVAISKQRKAFLNKKVKGGLDRHPHDDDRVQCAIHFTEHIEKCVLSKKEVKGARIGMVDFAKQAILLTYSQNKDPVLKKLLNSQWRDNSKQTGSLGNMIAMVDVSGSMDGDPLHAAIALGIRIAENSTLGKRVMTFSSKPKWVNLEHCAGDFVEQVKTVKGSEWGTNTNFEIALDNILSVIVQNKLPAADAEDMILVILSDMQMDQGDRSNKDVLYERMTRKYAEAGMKICGQPYKPPHILFWNLRSTSGFPVLSSQKNTSMMSGFSAALLNLFCDEGMNALKSCTPWSLLLKSLDNERYSILGNKLEEIVQ